jgi:cytochrome P450
MNLPPGPRSFADLLRMLFARKKNPIKLYEDIFRVYGDIAYFHLGSYRFAMLNDADAIEQVLQTEAKNFTKSTGYERFKLIVGNGLLVSEEEVWRKQRRLLSWAFSSKNIERIHHVMVSETESLVSRWKERSAIDLAEEMNLITLQIISVSLFGKSQLDEANVIRDSLQDMLKYLQTTKHLWIQFFLWPLPIKNKRDLALRIEANLPFKDTKKFFKAIENVDRIVHRMIKERKEKHESSNFLDAMIEATDSEDSSQMTPQQLRDEVVNMLIAGHETTANALTWTWRQMLSHPDVYEKVKAEIDSVISGAAPTFEELPRLVYTKAVLEESMRLFPPFWRISRKNYAATKIKGYDIPAGTNVIASIYTIHRKESHWPDPLRFQPERFIGDKKGHHRFAFIPFGGGPRACIGSQFAIFEALTIMAICLKNFDFEKKFSEQTEYFISLTLQPQDGCPVSLKPRERT